MEQKWKFQSKRERKEGGKETGAGRNKEEQRKEREVFPGYFGLVAYSEALMQK